jgi:glycosyltransferase involved in cell wall biosynthesis
VAIEASARYRLAVILPCLNEAAAIASVIGGFRAALPAAQVFVIDSGSTDGTADVVRAHGAEVLLDGSAAVDGKVQAITVISARDAADSERRLLREGYRFGTLWRARCNLCVEDGEARADDLTMLRLTAPEVYCI